jgi:hypothetical protein
MGYLHDESKQENRYRLSRMPSQDSCWHLRWLETELTLTGERSAVNVARSVRRGLAGKAGNAARWLATLQNTQVEKIILPGGLSSDNRRHSVAFDPIDDRDMMFVRFRQ